ncbi:2-polyprenyl-6-methoxyphenol hydroxylase [Ramlibacter henchirensis]|uniref:2-polyprenyl-6-methoxyphenol hydroxylase n=1 Tax=Ramlibacter henchirensis TaxID=204072 RepID=A0A4Z0BWD1_9BURK|nr:FAD-dependent monooxygenase [Ramlibacter henchirensis]TFZ02794.1 2-polyprenyl-6-methoxyphenol hydroxylase [Ramlibacter henchirensis]
MSNSQGKGRPHVLIAGAGMGGLTLAAALLQKGFDVDVYEQAPELREVGAGLWISANGARVLDALGLKRVIEAINLPPQDRVVRFWKTGEEHSVYTRNSDSKADHTLIQVLRAELQRVLHDAVVKLKPGAVHFGVRSVGVENVSGRARLLLEDGTAVEGDVVVGCDGAHSRIRQSIFGPAPARYTGANAWRGLAPMEKLKPQHRRPLASTWVGPTAHVTTYPVQRNGEEFVSFSGQVDSETWQTESWSERGELADALKDFEGWHQDILDLFIHSENLFRWGIFVRDPLDRWSKGRVTLVGDACHSMTPYLGMGVNLTFEDAYVLARSLESTPGDVEGALKRYDAARIERANRTKAKSLEMLPIFHNPELARSETAWPYIQSQWSEEAVRARYDWLLAYDATTVEIR